MVVPAIIAVIVVIAIIQEVASGRARLRVGDRNMRD